MKLALAACAAIGVYIFLWNKKRKLAVIILLLLTAYILGDAINWTYLRRYFFVDWGSGGIGN